MTRVALLKCNEYDNKMLCEVISRSMSASGFDMDCLSGARVALKPNLLMPIKPEKAVITHPEFFKAAAQVVIEHGGKPVLIENPNFFSLESTIKRVGYAQIVDELGIEVAKTETTRPLYWEGGDLYRNIEISSAYFDVDVILNLVKFKTHSFTYITGAVKHLFGTIPGLRKSRMHMRVPGQEEFADFLLDLYGALEYGLCKEKTLFHIVDGVMSMEGDGPGPAGNPKHLGVVLAGKDAIAVDWVAVSVAGLDPKRVFTLTKGFARDFGPDSPKDIQVVGEKIQDLASDFAPPKNTIFGGVLWPITSKTVKNWFVEKPVPDPEKCELCYQCKKTCPAGAISKAAHNKKIPRFDYRKCIRCFCCMEICPEAAIGLKKGVLQWMITLK